MGLIELCLLSLVTPQEPAAPTAPAVAVQAPVAPAEQGPRALLVQLEAAGDYADASALAALTSCEDAEVAARAAWLLAASRNQTHVAALPDVFDQSPHADARLHAMNGLLQRGDTASTATAIEGLEDEDRRVRTVAAQLLGKLRRPASVEPLLRLVRAGAERSAPGDATDVQAALLALADLGASGHLLRMATGLGEVAGCGAALTFAFQQLSPDLEPRQETTTLIAVLDHPEQLLRRYAITRLTELAEPRSVAALEARLDREGPALVPLLEVAVGQLRGNGSAQPANEVERAVRNAENLAARAAAWWSGLRLTDQVALCAIPSALLVGLWLVQRSLRNRAFQQDAQAAAALASHSEDYYDDHDEAGEGDYEDDEAFDAEAAEAFDLEEDEGFEADFDEASVELEDDDYDTTGWEEEPVPTADAPADDDLFR